MSWFMFMGRGTSYCMFRLPVAELDLLVLSKLCRSIVSTMLSLLLRCGVSRICSIDGKDIHHPHSIRHGARVGEGEKFLANAAGVNSGKDST